jgi:hypothetical protein
VSKRLALGVLNIAQGHPKLLELADGQAADPAGLTALVAAGDQAWQDAGGLPPGFFATGEASASGEDYLSVLAAWTRAVTETLSPGERTLFWFLCCLEESDREEWIVEGNWADLLGRLGLDGEAPDLDQAAMSLAAQGMVAVRDEPRSFGIHPGVALAGREQAGEPFQDAVDMELGAFWNTVFQYASGEADRPGVSTGLMARAGLSAAPYLIRQEQWHAASALLDGSMMADPSRSHAAAVLPAVREVAAHRGRAASVLARALAAIDRGAAEAQVRALMDAAVAEGDYYLASSLTTLLMYQCLESGRLAEALALTDQRIQYSQRAGLGPWTQLLDEIERLQVLNAMGQADRVLPEVQRLRERMRDLPGTAGEGENVLLWNVRETLLDTGRRAAVLLGSWDEALELNAEQVASKRARDAIPVQIAQNRFNDYAPLVRLGRVDEALTVLLECRQVFQDAHHIGNLGKTFGALAYVEEERGHGDTSVRMESDALRYIYLAGDVRDIATSYKNLGNYLHRYARQPAAALACHLTATLIRALIAAGDAEISVGAAAWDLREFGANATLPADIAGLCGQLPEIPGTDPAGLLAKLSPDAATADRALAEIVRQVTA